jgi:hypothetical protein
VHLAAADVHVVGERVGEVRRDRPDLAPDAAEVVQQPRPVGRKLGEQRGQSQDVRTFDYRESFPSEAPGSP